MIIKLFFIYIHHKNVTKCLKSREENCLDNRIFQFYHSKNWLFFHVSQKFFFFFTKKNLTPHYFVEVE